MINRNIKAELESRWKSIQKKMQNVGAEACLLSISVNLFYVSGRVFSGYFYLPANGDPLFFVRRPQGLTGENVYYIRKPEEITAMLAKVGAPIPKMLLLEADDLSFNEYRRLQDCFGEIHFHNATPLIRAVRTVKSNYEMELFRNSGNLHIQCYQQVASLYQNHFTDLDFSIEIERLFRKHGSIGHFRIFGSSMEIFMGSVLAGDNALSASPYDFAMGGSGVHASLPIGPAGIPLTKGMSVMVDMGGTFTGYITDMTRVFSVGKLSQKAYDAHQVSIEIHHEIANVARPGVAAADLYQLAYSTVQKYSLEAHFMGYGQQAGFIGHGVGIEINESPVLSPRSKDVLSEGHVFALEPKFVIPGTGAVGIENTYIVNQSGVENVTDWNESIIEL